MQKGLKLTSTVQWLNLVQLSARGHLIFQERRHPGWKYKKKIPQEVLFRVRVTRHCLALTNLHIEQLRPSRAGTALGNGRTYGIKINNLVDRS